MAEPANKPLNPPAVAEDFSLSRWSRLKRGGAKAPEQSAVTGRDAQALPVVQSVDDANSSSEPTSDASAEFQLPPISSISLAEDFTPFMQAKVPQAIRQQALKALFKEPHFNVMDRLDIYIDDYTQFEPIPPEVLATLSSWKTIMNPPQQIVTSRGYAVDVESEEGKAALAERAREQQAQHEQQESAAADTDGVSQTVDDMRTDSGQDKSKGFAPTEATPAPTPLHARHGKRVGEFSASDFVETEIAQTGAEISDHTIAGATALPIAGKTPVSRDETSQ